MPSAFRDPKSLPEWIELDYYRQERPIRRFRGLLGWSALLLSGVILGLAYWGGNQQLYQAGPVSDAHRMFNNDCAACHVESFQTARRLIPTQAAVRSVTDDACQKCHPGAIHHEQQIPMRGAEACAECHQEHLGRPSLSRVSDRHCLLCHEDLKRGDGKAGGFAKVSSLGSHPEFTWRRPETRRSDPGTIRFNHAVHLEEGGVLMPDTKQLELLWAGQPAESPVRILRQLSCQDCHQADASGRSMMPISFEAHCKSCHLLPVRIVGGAGPAASQTAVREFEAVSITHPKAGESASVVRAEIRDRFTKFVQQHPSVLSPPETSSVRRFPGWESYEVSKQEHEWVNKQVGNAWRVLLQSKGGCQFCHEIAQPGKPGDEPTIARSQINERYFPRLGQTSDRWLPHGLFRHDSHRMLRCDECHDARSSQLTSDVLMPPIASCQKCHNPAVGARSDCVTCHRYHDRAKERGFGGGRSIEECLGIKESEGR